MRINRSSKRSRHGDVRRAVREAFVNGLPPAAAAPSAEASRALPRPSATLLCGLGSVPGLALDQLRTAGLVSLPLNSRGEGGGGGRARTADGSFAGDGEGRVIQIEEENAGHKLESGVRGSLFKSLGVLIALLPGCNNPAAAIRLRTGCA